MAAPTGSASDIKIVVSLVDDATVPLRLLRGEVEKLGAGLGGKLTGAAKGAQQTAEALRATSTEAAKLAREAGKAASELDGVAAEPATRIDKTASAFGGLTAIVTRYVSVLALAATASRAFREASAFDKEFSRIPALLSSAAGGVGDLRAQLFDLSRESGADVARLATGIQAALTQGARSTADALKVLTAALDLERAGFGSVLVNIDAVSNSLSAYRLGAAQAARVSNVLFVTAKESGVAFDALAAGLDNVLPLAANLGIGFENVASALIKLKQGGLDTSKAFRLLQGVLQSGFSPESLADGKKYGVDLAAIFETVDGSFRTSATAAEAAATVYESAFQRIGKASSAVWTRVVEGADSAAGVLVRVFDDVFAGSEREATNIRSDIERLTRGLAAAQANLQDVVNLSISSPAGSRAREQAQQDLLVLIQSSGMATTQLEKLRAELAELESGLGKSGAAAKSAAVSIESVADASDKAFSSGRTKDDNFGKGFVDALEVFNELADTLNEKAPAAFAKLIDSTEKFATATLKLRGVNEQLALDLTQGYDKERLQIERTIDKREEEIKQLEVQLGLVPEITAAYVQLAVVRERLLAEVDSKENEKLIDDFRKLIEEAASRQPVVEWPIKLNISKAELRANEELVGSWLDGLKAGFEETAETITDFRTGFVSARAAADSFVDNFSSALVAFASGAKSAGDAFKDFARGLLADLASIIAKALSLKVLEASLLGLGIAPLAMGGVVDGSLQSSYPVKAYASGGVANSPQVAVFGEAGAEAFVPLPGKNRGIPVEMRGGGTSNIVVSYNITTLDARGVKELLEAHGRVIGDIAASQLSTSTNRSLVTSVRGAAR